MTTKLWLIGFKVLWHLARLAIWAYPKLVG
jgi:hypothetical protein